MSKTINFQKSEGCPVCLAFAIQSHDRTLLEALLSQPVNFQDSFILPAPTVLLKDPTKYLRSRIPPPNAEFDLNLVGSCGHELLDREIRLEFNQEYVGFYLENLVELAFAYATQSFNALESLIQSKKFDLSEPVLYHRLIVPPYLTHHIREAGKSADCFAFEYMRSSSSSHNWIPGPLRLVNIAPVITSIGALAFENARTSNMLCAVLNPQRRLINHSILQGGYNDLWPFNLKCLDLEAQNSLLVTFYKALFSYDNFKLDALNAYIDKLEFLLGLESFDVNAPLTWRKLNCFDDGSRNLVEETHFLYEHIGVIFSFPDRSAADHALRLYRVLMRHGLCSFPANEFASRLQRSPTLSAPLADSIALAHAGLPLSPAQPDTLFVRLFGFESHVPEYVVPRAETLVRQLLALGYARAELHAGESGEPAEGCGLRRTRGHLKKNPTRREAGAALRRLVAEFDAGPLALKLLARIAIRRALRGPSFARLAPQLPLPRLLLDFVILAEEEL